MRELLKKLIHVWPWPLTLNERYDRQTKAIIQKVCQPESVCIDVGCYKGDILRAMIQAAPRARHIAFEPVPDQYQYLKEQFSTRADIYPYALGNENTSTVFHHVKSNPTYSGLRQREYKGEENIQEIQVEVRQMDEIIPHDVPVTLLKIDVEGGEYDVMEGASSILKKWHPYIIFEHGEGGSDKYGITPGDVYDLLVLQLGYKICLMADFLKDEKAPGFSIAQFEQQYWTGLNCYFMAVYDKD